MSTRRAEDYQWDHGAQYFSPKTDEFARAVEEWRTNGLCEAWDAAHCVWSAEAGVAPDPKSEKAKRHVGIPGMNAICKGLLVSGDRGIDTRFETRAAARSNPLGGWTMEDGKTGADLGDFDFVISTDKTSTALHRQDLDRKLLDGFVKPAAAVRSYPSLALMVATKKTHLEFDSLLLDGHPAFSWLARDDSKPGRHRDDGLECWVAHAAPSFTQRLIDSSKKTRGKRYPNAFRSAIVRDLLPQFQTLVNELKVGGEETEVLLAQGHRWGAAFPVAPFGAAGQFYLDREHAFAACGDYFTPFPGRVEGAWISGSSLADELLRVGLQEP